MTKPTAVIDLNALNREIERLEFLIPRLKLRMSTAGNKKVAPGKLNEIRADIEVRESRLTDLKQKYNTAFKA